MAKQQSSDLVIEAPRNGIAPSPHVGFADVRNLDIDSAPGIVKLNNILVKKSGTTVVTQVNWMVRHPITIAEVYALDSGGKVYRSGDSGATWALMTGNTQTSCHGNGLMIWKNYLFVARDTCLDICGDGAASGNGTTTGIANNQWTNDWTTSALASDVLWHPMLVSKNDNKLYIGAGQYVFSLEENSGQTFAPGTPTTYTMTEQALDLPPAYRIKCIEELGNNLMLGTWQGTTVTDIRIADIFPWDRSSPSFGQPITLSEYGIHAMKNVGNSLIVLAGTSGTIYRCDGSNAYVIGQLPIDLSGGKYLEWYPGALTYYKNKIFFGVGNGGTTAMANMGIYSLQQTGQGNILSLEHTISTLNDGANYSLKPSALLPITRDTLLVGWRDNITYGIDLISAGVYTAYTTATEADSYSETNYAATVTKSGDSSDEGVRDGQSFTSLGGLLDSCKFYLKKFAAGTVGTAYAELYAHTGVFGTGGKPTGSILATSDVVDVSAWTTDLALITFTFTGSNKYSMSAGANYFIIIRYIADTGDDNKIQFGVDNSTLLHGGNRAYGGPTTWTAVNTVDHCFYLYETAYAGCTGYFDTPLYAVGTIFNKRSFTQLEFQLTKELASTESIKIAYRLNLTDSFTDIDTYSYTNLGAVTSHNATADIPATEFIQLRVYLYGSETTTPELRTVLLR